MLFVYNSNPAVTTPDQGRVLRGLERDDLFTVVFEQVMTDTARYADVLLPNTTFLEGYDLVRAYGPWALQLARPVIEPVGESRSNADVFGELIDRAGMREETDPRGELEEMLDVIARLPDDDGRRRPRQRRCDRRPSTAGRSSSATCGRGPRIGRSTCIRRRWHRTRLRDCTAISRTRRRASFPLALISPASEKTISSTLAELPRPEVRLLMHPDDAAAARRERRRLTCACSTRWARCGARLASALDSSRHGLAAEGNLAEAHGQRLHRHRARARHADRSRWRRVLQRRPRASRARTSTDSRRTVYVTVAR